MKSDRLLSLLLLLQARGRISERELAEALEVSQRTIHRDLESLSAARVPVVALRGAQGGWELDKTWRSHIPALDESELQALIMVQPRTTGSARFAAAAESALNKVMASLPGPIRQHAVAVRERIHIDANGWWESGEDLSALPLLQDAVTSDRRLAFDYMRADGQKARRVADPLGLVAKGTSWYLIARTRDGYRTFRVSRMQNVTSIAQIFKRPTRFNLSKYWKKSVSELESKRTEFRVRMHVTLPAAQRLAQWSKVCTLPDTAEPGWTAVEVVFDHPQQAAFVTRGLGESAQIIAPLELRRDLEKEIVRRAQALNRP